MVYDKRAIVSYLNTRDIQGLAEYLKGAPDFVYDWPLRIKGRKKTVTLRHVLCG